MQGPAGAAGAEFVAYANGTHIAVLVDGATLATPGKKLLEFETAAGGKIRRVAPGRCRGSSEGSE